MGASLYSTSVALLVAPLTRYPNCILRLDLGFGLLLRLLSLPAPMDLVCYFAFLTAGDDTLRMALGFVLMKNAAPAALL